MNTGKNHCAAVNLPIWSVTGSLLDFPRKQYILLRAGRPSAAALGRAVWDLERRENV